MGYNYGARDINNGVTGAEFRYDRKGTLLEIVSLHN